MEHLAEEIPSACQRGSARHNLNNNVLKRADQRRRRSGAAPLPPNIAPHTLRRTFVAMSARRGKSLSWIVGQIGHHDFTTTHRCYTCRH